MMISRLMDKTRRVFLSGVMLMTTMSLDSHTPGVKVHIVGAMRETMWNGVLHANVKLDTLLQQKGLYGLGPMAGLRGEIMVLDGVPYYSQVGANQSMVVGKSAELGAPFFGYTYIKEWQSETLPAQVRDIASLEAYLKERLGASAQTFFRLKGKVDMANIHVVNLPEGAVVRSPKEAHQGMVNYKLYAEDCEILGFFSTQHETIFTHKGNTTHMHLINEDKNMMGHLDEIAFEAGQMILLLPKEVR